MRLLLDSDPRINLVRRYDAGVIEIGERQITRPCLVTPQQLVLDWDASSIAGLSEPQLEPLWALRAAIVLLGAAEYQQPPTAAIRAAFHDRGIALECMSLGAACRTYNILANEARSVIAGLFP
ncbi:MAG: Mth938-like domain-containing protein [Steroidobacterales bacterium]